VPPPLLDCLLTNAHGAALTVTNYGGRIVRLLVPDRHGVPGDVVLGYDDLNQYLSGNLYFGALIGRVGNRTANGEFTLLGKQYRLAKNNGNHGLHGGPGGFHQVFWNMTPQAGGQAVILKYHSPDGEEGYPGNLDVTVTYTLTDDNAVVIDYAAVADQATPVNLTHHSFFNLAGAGSGDILQHMLQINGAFFCPVDVGLIPTGERRHVTGTPFDFIDPHPIGERIGAEDQQLSFGKGYDHNWILSKQGKELSLAASVSDPSSGRVMEVWTTEPGLQFYSGNFLSGTDVGKGHKVYARRSGFCLEAQHFPDALHHPEFPSIVLAPGDTYRQQTIYKFGVVR